MHVVIKRKNFFKALVKSHRIVEKRNLKLVLANVLIKTVDGKLIIQATDLELEMTAFIADVNILIPGSTTLPASTLYDIVKKLPEDSDIDLQLEDNANILLLKSGRSKFRLQCIPEKEFPEFEEIAYNHKFILPPKDLRIAIEKTRYAIPAEETHAFLGGVYFHCIKKADKHMLHVVATDYHRLSLIEIVAPEGSFDIPGIIIPKKVINELHRLLEGYDKNIEIRLSSVKICFVFDDIILTSKLIDGKFPDYSKVIPFKNDKVLCGNKQDMLEVVDRVATVFSEHGRAIKFAAEKNNLILSANNPDIGSVVEELSVDYQASQINIGFNFRYLLDILSRIENDNISFKLLDSFSPVLIEEDISNDQITYSTIYVLMPLRV